MKTFLTINDGLKRTLGYLDDDTITDKSVEQRMTMDLAAAERSIQMAVGEDNLDFYQSDGIKDLYTIACNAVAANFFNHPSSAQPNLTEQKIVGQLRGAYDEAMNKDDTTTEC